ncbi:retrovirus-related pol polyprotein from transposon TNT 1-94 [Tanacetum coccineum]
MSTLAEFMIVAGADNRPPMLDEPQYESWKIRMELCIQENATVRPKTYEELSDMEKFMLIVIQGYQHCFKQERKCKLYDKFDKFSYVKGETVYQYYLWFALLINDMNIIQMTMQPVQVNTKFLNSLPPEWGKFITDVKLARDLHTSNYDQLYAYLQQHEAHANEACFMRERFPDPLALVANTNPYGAPHHPQQSPTTYPTTLNHTQPFVPQNAYPPPTLPQQPQAEFPQLDSGLVVPTFLPSDDPISCMNKEMAFMSAVFSSRYPSTNNQLGSSSNPRNQATAQDGRVTIQQVQGRQGQNVVSSGSQGNASSSKGNTSSQAKVVKCYNCQGEGHMARQYAYDSDCDDISSAKAVLMANLSSCDSDVLYEVSYSDISQNDMMNQGVQELQYSEQSPIIDYPDNKITGDSNIIPYSQYLEETQHAIVQNTNTSAQQNSMILSMFEQMSNHATNWDKANNESKIVNESLTAELERYKERVKILEQ